MLMTTHNTRQSEEIYLVYVMAKPKPFTLFQTALMPSWSLIIILKKIKI